MEDSLRPEYQARFRKVCNIGVILGRPSDNLCAIDCDSEETLERVVRGIPELAKTFTVAAKRGAKFFVRVVGDYPRKANGEKCDWLADGAQAVVIGTHPEKDAHGGTILYRVTNPVPPISIPWCRIREAILPFVPSLARKATPALPECPESNRESVGDARELEPAPEAPAGSPGPAVEAVELDENGNPPGFPYGRDGNPDREDWRIIYDTRHIDDDPHEGVKHAVTPESVTESSDSTEVVGIGETCDASDLSGGVSRLVETWKPRVGRVKPGRGSNDKNLFALNRLCLDFESELDRPLSASERSEVFRAWVQFAQGELKPDEDREGVYWEKFEAGRANAKIPLSVEPLRAAENEASKLIASRGSNALDAAIKPWEHDPSVKSPSGYAILALCFCLQKAAMTGSLKGVFFVSTRDAARFIGDENPVNASRKFRHFEHLGILRVAEKGRTYVPGGPKAAATRFQLIPLIPKAGTESTKNHKTKNDGKHPAKKPRPNGRIPQKARHPKGGTELR